MRGTTRNVAYCCLRACLLHYALEHNTLRLATFGAQCSATMRSYVYATRRVAVLLPTAFFLTRSTGRARAGAFKEQRSTNSNVSIPKMQMTHKIGLPSTFLHSHTRKQTCRVRLTCSGFTLSLSQRKNIDCSHQAMQKSTTWVPFKSIMLCKVNSTSSGRRKTNVPNPLELYLAQNTPKATHEGTSQRHSNRFDSHSTKEVRGALS